MISPISVFSTLTLGSGIILAFLNYYLLGDGQLPVISDDHWGQLPVSDKQSDFSIRPFPINVSDLVLQDLRSRLKLEIESWDTRVEPTLVGQGFGYGISSNWIRTVVNHWLYKYDWKKREKILNQFPGFTTTISGLSIYFKHIKPEVSVGDERVIKPLLLLHGYPGSFADYRRVVNLLRQNSEFAFEVRIRIFIM